MNESRKTAPNIHINSGLPVEDRKGQHSELLASDKKSMVVSKNGISMVKQGGWERPKLIHKDDSAIKTPQPNPVRKVPVNVKVSDALVVENKPLGTVSVSARLSMTPKLQSPLLAQRGTTMRPLIEMDLKKMIPTGSLAGTGLAMEPDYKKMRTMPIKAGMAVPISVKMELNNPPPQSSVVSKDSEKDSQASKKKDFAKKTKETKNEGSKTPNQGKDKEQKKGKNKGDSDKSKSKKLGTDGDEGNMDDDNEDEGVEVTCLETIDEQLDEGDKAEEDEVDEEERSKVVNVRKLELRIPKLSSLLLRPNEAKLLTNAAGEQLGEGRTSVAYQVEIKNMAVAVKVWRKQRRVVKSDVEYLRNEARILRRCHSPNVIDFYGFYDVSPYICLVSEVCDKGTLADFVAKSRVLSRFLARRFILELENAMNYVHSRGFIHRDIKPENCFIKTDEDSFQLKDFGHATSIESSQPSVRGTDLWAAPELDRGLKATFKSDVYSFGLVARFLVAGKTHDPRNIKYGKDWNAVWTTLIRECIQNDPQRRPSHEVRLSLIAKLPEQTSFKHSFPVKLHPPHDSD